MQTKLVSLKDIRPNPDNPRIIKDDKFHKLVQSIKDFPEMLRLRPIVVNAEMVVLGGNMRLKACQAAGLQEVPTILASGLTDEQQREFIIKDNVGFGEWEWDALANEWDADQLTDWGLDIPDFEKAPADGLTDADDVPEPPADPVSVLGDLWVLGNHRVLCGDSTSVDAVEVLLEKHKVQMVFTDPPWNVNYGAVQRGNPQGYKPRTIINDHMDAENWQSFMSGIAFSLSIACQPGAPIYVVMSAQEWPAIDRALREANFHWSSTIIWAKDRLVLSRKDYHTQYEPIWYGWQSDAARLVPVTDRKQSDLWQISRPSKSELHPTTKPVELIEKALKNSSKSDELVLDLFGGSGSTLIGCERQHRHARLMELDPKYVDVIVKRWQDFTGRDAIHSITGETFTTIASSRKGTG